MKSLLLIFILAFSLNLKSQNIIFQPYNLDFEIGTPPAMPFIWEITQKSAENEYVARADDENFFSGKRAITMFNFTPQKNGTYGTLYQKFDAFRYKNKKVFLSANVLTKFEGDSSNLRLFIHEYDKNGKTIKIEQMINDPILKANWDEFKIEMEISNDAYYISIGAVMAGRGAVFIDNMKFDIIRQSHYSFIDNSNLSPANIDNILNFTKVYSYLRFQLPTSEMLKLEPYNFIRYGIDNVINSKDIVSSLNKVFNPIFPIANISNNNKAPNYNHQKTALHGYGMLNKTRVAYNNGSSNISNTDIKNIYTPDKDKQGYMLRYISGGGLGGKELIFSSNVKTKLKNLYSNAQLWIRVQRQQGEDINVYMMENPIISPDWQKFENKIKLPENTSKITIGCVLIGDGEVWFDDLKVEVSGDGHKIEIPELNQNFDDEKPLSEPKEWKIPNSIKLAGYEYYIDETESNSKPHSLKISTLNTFIVNYPDIYKYNNYKISDNVFLNMPNGIEVGENGSLPYPDSLKYNKILNVVNNNDLNINDLYSRISILVELYSYIRNYYIVEPNFDLNKLDVAFKESISKIGISKVDEFEAIIRKFLAILNDPQIRLWKLGDENSKSLPFTFEYYEDGFHVSQIYKQVEGLNVGDKILKIEDIDIDKYVLNELQFINGFNSNLTTTNKLNEVSPYLINRAIARIVMGDNKKELLFDFEDKKINFTKDVWNSEYIKSNVVDIMKPDSNIMYINMAMFDDKFFKYLANEINNVDGLIFDARGNSLISEHFLGYFLLNNVKTNMTKVPYFVEPNKENVQFEILQPFLKKLDTALTKNVVFLIDENTIGYSEFIMNLVDYYEIGTLIGRKSVGMPSDIVSITLPLDYSFSFSAFEVFNPAEKNIMFKPILPDIEVKNTFNKEDKDLILEKAVEYLKEKINSKK